VKASLPKLLNSFVRHTAVRFTSRRPVSKIGDQGMSARNEVFVSWGCDESVRNAHGLCPVLQPFWLRALMCSADRSQTKHALVARVALIGFSDRHDLDRFASTSSSPLAVHERHGRNLILPSGGLLSRCRESWRPIGASPGQQRLGDALIAWRRAQARRTIPQCPIADKKKPGTR